MQQIKPMRQRECNPSLLGRPVTEPAMEKIVGRTREKGRRQCREITTTRITGLKREDGQDEENRRGRKSGGKASVIH